MEKNEKYEYQPKKTDLLYSYYIQILAKKVMIYRPKICAGQNDNPWIQFFLGHDWMSARY